MKLVRKPVKNQKARTPRQLERYFKGVANHRRIQILDLLSEKDGLMLEEISEKLRCNLKTISGHTQKLVQAGLISKWYEGRTVRHKISPYGKKVNKFIQTF